MATKTGETRTEPVGTSILEQFADLSAESMSPEIAHKLLKVRFAPAHTREVNDLSEKAQEGTLTPLEADKLDEYIRVADLLGILQSRAHRALLNAGHAS